eukprot:sb/3476915/
MSALPLSKRDVPMTGGTTWCRYDGHFIPGYCSGTNLYPGKEGAQNACGQRSDCKGVTWEPYNKGSSKYTLRKGHGVRRSPAGNTSPMHPHSMSFTELQNSTCLSSGEVSWVKC